MAQSLKNYFHAGRRRIAGFWLNGLHRSVLQIGITGSYGKTSTASAVGAVLGAHAATLMTDLNLDTIYNVPITALQVRARHRYLVLELGIDSPGEMDFHLQIARPTIGVLTGISPVHSDEKHLGSLEAIIQQKGRLIEALGEAGTAILNRDDAHVRTMAGRTRARVLWYGRHEGSHYRVVDIQQAISGTTFRLLTPEGEHTFDTQLLGEHNAVNLAAAAAVARSAGVPFETIRQAFADLQPLRGRLNVEAGPGGLILINDALRANPASTRAGLAFLAGLMGPGRKAAVLGEMGELGRHARAEHAAIGKAAAAAHPDLLITVGELTRHTAEAAVQAGLSASRVYAAADVHQAAARLQDWYRSGDVIYLKGSLMRHMERIRLILEGRIVGCRVVACPFYHQCTDCQYLEKGYNSDGQDSIP
jgi:UDP-N-acetylmuramoyl-tripeptide--D-alanyl-D-alanine ligase